MVQPDGVKRKLTENPKLGVLGWGLAGGPYSTHVPSSILGAIGVALFFVGVVRSLAAGVPFLALLFFLASVLCICGGYMRYSGAYDREEREMVDKGSE
ncbi:MAG: hypothetical protein Q8P22_09450 [Chloroflexota bacterium]|nr:hypothetical protein [Chloroflexota bacterium]